jgi:tRNA G10  N-methylase Trm11
MQYPAGTSDLILDAISNQIRGVDVLYRDDSATIFDSRSSAREVASLPFAKNAFMVLTSTARGNIDKGVEQLGRSVSKIQLPNQSPRVNAFRTMIHIDGELSSVSQKSKRALEGAIASRTGAHLEPRGKCQEYWVIGRLDMRELLLCMRLPKPKRPPKARGALSYELSAMLVHASRPHPKDTILDPFAGSGSFVQARLEFPAHKIWYSDRDLRAFRPNLPREMTTDKRVGFLSDDALTLPSFPDGGVDVIVTDPPWGEHEDLGMPYSDFANAMAKNFDRVLDAVHGRFVILCSRRTSEIIVHSLKGASFEISVSHSILVNGHPATVLVGGREKS